MEAPKKPEGVTTVKIGPHYDAPEGSPMGDFEISNALLQAENNFKKLLPELLETSHEEQWIYVAWDGKHEFRENRDDAEIAAMEAGYSKDDCVIREVSPSELDDDVVHVGMGGAAFVKGETATESASKQNLFTKLFNFFKRGK
jgi:hypothetical protein